MAFSLSDIGSKNLTKSHRHPYGIRSDGGRNLIGRRTESDRTANGIRLDGVRNLIGRRTESDWAANANGGKSNKKIRNTCCAGIADKGLFYCASIINMLLQKDVT